MFVKKKKNGTNIWHTDNEFQDVFMFYIYYSLSLAGNCSTEVLSSLLFASSVHFLPKVRIKLQC